MYQNKTEFPEVSGLEEGKDYISLVADSKHILGRALSINYNYVFKTLIGDVRGIGRFMQYVSTKGYPYRLVMKGQFSNKDLGIIKKLPTLKLPNYWAIMAYALCTRVSQDPKLQKWLKENTLPLTIARWEVRNKYVEELSKPVYVNVTQLANYLNIVRDIEKLLKEDRFVTDEVIKLINGYKYDQKVSVFHNAIREVPRPKKNKSVEE
jgi:hypothetical protein|nr:MAG TPA: hypothetical protein [Caudoviricetes sp.]DAR60932.1 MAG TPA: hypothetical protein [Caudoviricetes sp.]